VLAYGFFLAIGVNATSLFYQRLVAFVLAGTLRLEPL
jgi:hypothetical protein